MITVITRSDGDQWMVGWIAVGYNQFATCMNDCAPGGYFNTEDEALAAHQAMVDRLDQAAMRRARVVPMDGDTVEQVREFLWNRAFF